METTQEVHELSKLYYKVISKLIGSVAPVGSSEIDEDRLLNLKVMCEVVNRLVGDIDNVSYNNKDAYQASIKKAQQYANNFLTETLGIKE